MICYINKLYDRVILIIIMMGFVISITRKVERKFAENKTSCCQVEISDKEIIGFITDHMVVKIY